MEINIFAGANPMALVIGVDVESYGLPISSLMDAKLLNRLLT